MIRAETGMLPTGAPAGPPPTAPPTAPATTTQNALNPWAIWNPAVSAAMTAPQPRWSGNKSDWPQFKRDWNQWEKIGGATGTIPNEIRFNRFMQAADRGTQELLTAEREKNPGLTFQQWWDWLEASNTGDPLENTWNEWNNHHLVVEGGR